MQHERLLRFGLGGGGGISEQCVDRFGDGCDLIGTLHLHLERSDEILPRIASTQHFAQVDLAEEKRLASVGVDENANQGQLGINGKDIAGEEDFLADLPVHALREVGTRDRAGAQMREGFLPIVGQGDLGADAEKFVGFDAEAGEEIFPVARILIGSAKPLPYHLFPHTGNLANLISIAQREWLGDRHFVMHDEAQLLAGVGRRKE